MALKYCLLIATSFLFCLGTQAQTPGSLDTTFNSSGIFTNDYGFQDNLTDVKIQPADQKILVSGTAITPSFSGKLLVARLLPNGTFDPTFNGTGSLIITNFNESYAYESVIKDDGKIIVGGAAADPSFQFSMLVMRLNTDGTLDSTFGTNGMVLPEISTGDDFATAMVEQLDHKIILAGTALDGNANNVPVVVRLNENGSIDSTFGVNGVASINPIYIDNELTSVVLQPDGKIVVSGHLDQGLTGGGQFDFDILLARFNTDGTPDTNFGVNGVVTTSIGSLVDDAFGLQMTADGNILVSGFTTLPNFGFDAVLIQYDSTGVLDPNFGNQGIVQYNYGDMDVAFDVEVQNDGNILIAGIAGQFVPADNDFMLSRYTSFGVLDSSFGTNGVAITPLSPQYDEAEGMALQADGKIVLAGKSNNGTQNDIAVARFINDLFSSQNELPENSGVLIYPNPVSKSGKLTISLDHSITSNTVFELYDLIGNCVLKQSISGEQGNNTVTIKIPAAISNGIYLVKFSDERYNSHYTKVLITE